MKMTAANRVNRQWLGWMVIILLFAATLRLFALTAVPPGLTHDEADHGITAVSILDGSREIYFSIGHGREPLYDYATAVLMAGVGPTYLAGRLTAVFFSLLLIAGMAAWVRRAFTWQTAVLTAAGLALGFWPLMAARQSLRSITLPALFVFAVFFFWHALTSTTTHRSPNTDYRIPNTEHRPPTTDHRSPLTAHLLSGLFLGLTFYTYIPARVLWLVFPLTWGYLWLTARPLAKQTWKGLLLQLGVAGLIGLPLFWYLQTHTGVEVRLKELSSPLAAALQGDFSVLSQNVISGLGIFTFSGDDFWRYNIPGRPLLLPVMAVLFAVGLIVALWAVLRPFVKRNQKQTLNSAACFLALAWLLLGLAPVLVTGASLSSTQAMGMQPVVYLFPALALGAILNWQRGGRRLGERRWALGLVLLIFGITAVFTVRDYFVTWANAPEVRVQYEAAMATAVHYLNEQDADAAAISTITPGQYHTPALAAMLLTNEHLNLRWFDGRNSLIIPHEASGLVILSGFAPLAAELKDYGDWQSKTIIPQPQTDLDQPLTVYELNAAEWLAANEAQFTLLPDVQFGEAAALLGYDLGATAVHPGETVQLVTLWRLQRAEEGVRLFTHISGADGVPFAQADGLSAPSESWQAGDLLLQLHQIPIPADTAVADYALTLGLYTCQNADCTQTERFPVFVNGQPKGDHLFLQNLTIGE